MKFVLSAFSLKIEVEIIHDEVILSTKRIAYIGSSVFEVLLLCSFCQKNDLMDVLSYIT